MEKRFKIWVARTIFILGILFLFQSLPDVTALATNCPESDYDCQINEIEREIKALKPAHEYNKKELSDLRITLRNLEARIKNLSTQLAQIEIDITQREEDLAYAQAIFEEKVNNYYRFVRLYDPLLPFFFNDASGAFLEINYKQKAADEDRKTMDEYAEDLLQLKTDKEELTANKVGLASAKAEVDKREEFLSGEVEKVESYLADLSSKQEQLLALKAGGFQTSIGDTPPTLEPCSGPPGSSNFCNPGFSPAFGAFSFGAPHRVGMSQYGAYGRSKQGQSAETILSAYYQGASLNKGYPVPGSITVDGYGSIPFEENYLLGIYEVPESWGNNGGFEALKAQAVAARSYALYTVNGTGHICPTESCQVYKPQLKSGKWKEAVIATRGWVLEKGGGPIGTYYSSTTGGFTITQWGWTGIKDAENGDWPNQAYEKISGSPWFYKGWYKNRSGNSCGRSNPWLTSEEMADVINAWKVLYQGGGDVSKVSPIDTGCWQGNPYSMSELASIGGFTSASSVSVVYGNDGSTLSVSFGTNKGTTTISGTELKKAFNLRAPGYVGIKSSLFNIEKI